MIKQKYDERVNLVGRKHAKLAKHGEDELLAELTTGTVLLLLT